MLIKDAEPIKEWFLCPTRENLKIQNTKRHKTMSSKTSLHLKLKDKNIKKTTTFISKHDRQHSTKIKYKAVFTCSKVSNIQQAIQTGVDSPHNK
jgi:hypothetical protein